MKDRVRKKLVLHKEQLRTVRSADLSLVVGGTEQTDLDCEGTRDCLIVRTLSSC